MTIKVGIVGMRGLSTLRGFRSIPEVEVAAICDLDENLLKEVSEKHNIPHTYRVYEDMLESDIDAVVVATPMQLHVPQTLSALLAGKHVMSEVTAGVTMDELWWLKETVEQSGKVYMLAENYCYIPENQLIRNMVTQGLFGDIYFGEGEYLHDVRKLAIRPSSNGEGGTTTWRKFWQLGKRGAFYPTHSLGPVMQWFEGDAIESISCHGSGWHADNRFRQDDTTLTIVRLRSGKMIKIRVDCKSPRPHNMNYYSLQGTKGCYEAARGLGDQPKIWLADYQEDGGHPQWQPLSNFNEFLPDRYKNVTEEMKNAGHWGGDYFIVKDFVDAIQGLKKPAIDVYDACEWTAVGLLSELSVMNNGRTIEMPDFRNAKHVKDQIIKL